MFYGKWLSQNVKDGEMLFDLEHFPYFGSIHHHMFLVGIHWYMFHLQHNYCCRSQHRSQHNPGHTIQLGKLCGEKHQQIYLNYFHSSSFGVVVSHLYIQNWLPFLRKQNLHHRCILSVPCCNNSSYDHNENSYCHKNMHSQPKQILDCVNTKHYEALYICLR